MQRDWTNDPSTTLKKQCTSEETNLSVGFELRNQASHTGQEQWEGL